MKNVKKLFLRSMLRKLRIALYYLKSRVILSLVPKLLPFLYFNILYF